MMKVIVADLMPGQTFQQDDYLPLVTRDVTVYFPRFANIGSKPRRITIEFTKRNDIRVTVRGRK